MFSYLFQSAEAPAKEPLAARSNILLAAAADKAASKDGASHAAAASSRAPVAALAASRPVAAKAGSGPAHVGLQVSSPTLSFSSADACSAGENMQVRHPEGRSLTLPAWG